MYFGARFNLPNVLQVVPGESSETAPRHILLRGR